jgi:cytochrome c
MRIMDYYRLNQIAMAVLGALLLFFGTRTIVNIAFQEHKPEVAEQKPEEKKPAGGGEAQLATLLASANEAHGADVAKKCSICHSFDKGGPNMIGPNLYGVVGRPVASHEGYEYSDALKAKAKELGNWDYEKIDHMINNPGAFVPGTKMALFPGLPDPKERADVLAFLRTKNDNPPPLPQAPAAGAPTAGDEQKPAEGAGQAAGGGGAEIDKLLASADPKQGESDAALCKVCHTFDKGGAAVVGPNLYGVIGRKIASVEGFNYTDALKAHQKDGVWTYELLDPWLTNPQAFAPGTAMAFPGLPDVKKRANVIAFLRAKSDSPAPLPSAGGATEKKPQGTPPAGAPAPAPSAETPAPAAPAPAPSAETPAPAAPPPAPSAETPAAPEAPPAAQTPAPAPSPSAETPAPPPAPSPQTPEPAAPAPPAETPAPAAPPPGPAPSAETPSAPLGQTPSAETPQPPAETPAPSAETPQPPAEAPPPSAETPPPSAETPPAETPAPSVETPSETPAPAEETGKSEGEGPFPSQPQPVYPEGPPPGE